MTNYFRIEELEGKLDELNAKIEIESNKVKTRMTKTDIKRFINKALRKEPLPMIRMLIKEIILYDDRVEIYYNHIEPNRPDAVEHQVFCVYREEIKYCIGEWTRHKTGDFEMLTVEMYF